MGADPYEEKGMKLGRLLMDEEAREGPVKRQSLASEGSLSQTSQGTGVPAGPQRRLPHMEAENLAQ